MVALLDETGARREGDRSFAYGDPFGLPRSDVDGDGDVDGTDYSLLSAAFGKSVGDVGYDVKADINLDGTIDTSDSSDLFTDYGQSLGRGNLSRDPTLSGGIGNRIGYAGYQWDPAASKEHVRNRVLDPVSGRWLKRDPIGYVQGPSLYAYIASSPMLGTDPSGLRRYIRCFSGCGGGFTTEPGDQNQTTSPLDDGDGNSNVNDDDPSSGVIGIPPKGGPDHGQHCHSELSPLTQPNTIIKPNPVRFAWSTGMFGRILLGTFGLYASGEATDSELRLQASASAQGWSSAGIYSGPFIGYTASYFSLSTQAVGYIDIRCGNDGVIHALPRTDSSWSNSNPRRGIGRIDVAIGYHIQPLAGNQGKDDHVDITANTRAQFGSSWSGPVGGGVGWGGASLDLSWSTPGDNVLYLPGALPGGVTIGSWSWKCVCN